MKIKYFFIIFLGIGIFMSLSKFPLKKTNKTLNVTSITNQNAAQLVIKDELPCLYTRFGAEVTFNLFAVHSLEKERPEKLGKFHSYYDQAIKKLDAGTLHYDQEKDIFIQLVFLLQIRHSVDWTPFNQLYEKYNKMSEEETNRHCKTDQTKLDYFYRQICEFSKLDFTNHFEAWKLPISTEAKIYVAKLNLKKPYKEVSRINPGAKQPRKKEIIKLKNITTDRFLFSTGNKVNPQGEKAWGYSPSVLGTDSDYDDRAQWYLINVEGSDTYLLQNKITQRYLFSAGEVPIKQEGGWSKSPRILGTDANYLGRAEWQLVRNGGSNNFLLKNKVTKRYLFSTGEPPKVDNEGGWRKSPVVLGTDENYENRAVWTIMGAGLKNIE